MPNAYRYRAGRFSPEGVLPEGVLVDDLQMLTATPSNGFGRSTDLAIRRQTFDLIALTAFNNSGRRKWSRFVEHYALYGFTGTVSGAELSVLHVSDFWLASSGLNDGLMVRQARLSLAADSMRNSGSFRQHVRRVLMGVDAELFGACGDSLRWWFEPDGNVLRGYATPLMLMAAVWVRYYANGAESFVDFCNDGIGEYLRAMSDGARIGLISRRRRLRVSDGWRMLPLGDFLTNVGSGTYVGANTGEHWVAQPRLLTARSWRVNSGSLSVGLELEVDNFGGLYSGSGRESVADNLTVAGFRASASDWNNRVVRCDRSHVVPDGSVSEGGEIRSGVFPIMTSDDWDLVSDFVSAACTALTAAGGVVERSSSAGLHLHFGRGGADSRIQGVGRVLEVDNSAIAKFLASTVGAGYSTWARMLPNARRKGTYYADRAGNFSNSLLHEGVLADWRRWLTSSDRLICSGSHTSAIDAASAHNTCEVRLGAATVLPFKVLGWLAVNRQVMLRAVTGRGSIITAGSCVDYVNQLFDHDDMGKDSALELAGFRDSYHEANSARGVFVNDASITGRDSVDRDDDCYCYNCESSLCECENEI